MSHKAGHIIIQSLLTVPTLQAPQRAQLEDIEERDQYTMSDRMLISLVAFQLADDEID